MKRSFFQVVVVSILLYGCTTWTLTKRIEKKLDGNYTRMLQAILNKSWRQHSTKPQLYGHLPPITKTIKVRRTRHAGHCWINRDELISDVLLWTTSYGWAKAGQPARTYIQQLGEDTECSPEDLPEAMNDRKEWQESVRDIRASGATWWWWLFPNFSQQHSLVVFLSRTFRIILANLYNAGVRIASILPLISNSSSHLSKQLGTVPCKLTTIGITITFIFHNIFSSQARSKYLLIFAFCSL